MITREELLKLLHYDEFTGVFKWRVSRGRVKAGAEAGCIKVNEDGKSYRYVRVNGRMYYGHRLVWLILTGQFPNDQIDHLDGDGLNNASVNLRTVTNSENGKNVRKRADNATGVTGVYWDRTYAKWHAQIMLNGKGKHLGYFHNFDEAVAVRKAAEKIHGFHPNHGTVRPL